MHLFKKYVNNMNYRINFWIDKEKITSPSTIIKRPKKLVSSNQWKFSFENNFSFYFCFNIAILVFI